MLIRERLERVLREQLGPGFDWSDQTGLGRGGIDLDSLDVVELTMRLEEEFEIAIPDEACDALPGLTVAGLAEWLEPQLNARPALFA